MQMRNIKPLLEWAIKNTDTQMVSKLFEVISPYCLKEEIYLTQNSLSEMESIYVSSELYELIKFEIEDITMRRGNYT